MLIGGMVAEYEIINANCEWREDDCKSLDMKVLLDITLREEKKGTREFATLAELLYVIIAMLGFLIFYRYQLKLNKKIDKGTVSASDYTILMHGIDDELDDEKSIQTYIKNLAAAKNLPPPNIERINIGRFIGNFERVKGKIKSIEGSLAAVEKALETEQDDKVRLLLYGKKFGYEAYLKKKEESLKNHMNRMKKYPTLTKYSIALITFKYHSEMIALLEAQTWVDVVKGTMARTFSCCRKGKFHFIERAPEPDDIRWMHIGFNDTQRFVSYLLSFGVSAILVLISFGLQLAIRIWQKKQIAGRVDRKTEWMNSFIIQVIQIVAAIGINLVNKLLTTATDWLTFKEKHLSESHFIVSKTMKNVVTSFLNSGIITFCLFYFE